MRRKFIRSVKVRDQRKVGQRVRKKRGGQAGKMIEGKSMNLKLWGLGKREKKTGVGEMH